MMLLSRSLQALQVTVYDSEAAGGNKTCFRARLPPSLCTVVPKVRGGRSVRYMHLQGSYSLIL